MSAFRFFPLLVLIGCGVTKPPGTPEPPIDPIPDARFRQWTKSGAEYTLRYASQSDPAAVSAYYQVAGQNAGFTVQAEGKPTPTWFDQEYSGCHVGCGGCDMEEVDMELHVVTATKDSEMVRVTVFQSGEHELFWGPSASSAPTASGK